MCAALAVLTTIACSRSSPPPTEHSGGSASHAGSRGPKDHCSLLEPKEVEAALGAPLATPPFLSRDAVPDDEGNACEYEDASLHNITIAVEWDGGAMAFKMYGAFQGLVNQTAAKGLVHLAEGADVAGEWDEARVVGCCTFVALRGDQMVTIDVGGSKAPMATAAKLADAALKRLEHALPISGGGHAKSAAVFEQSLRPARKDPCAIVSRAEAEAVLGRLDGDLKSIGPDDPEAKCVYEHTVDGKFGGTYVLKVRWTRGLQEFREHNAGFDSFTRSFTRTSTLSAEGKDAIVSAGSGTDLPANAAWDTAHWDLSGLSAVKKDVLISIEPQAASSDAALKLMEKVMSKL
jgi:hypothetical protein